MFHRLGIIAVVTLDAILPASVMLGALIFGIIAYMAFSRRTMDDDHQTALD